MSVGLGIDVGGSKILACAIDDGGRLLAEERFDSPSSSDELVGAIGGAIDAVDVQLRSLGLSLTAVCVGLPGLVDENDILNETPNIPSAEGLDLRASLLPDLERRFSARGIASNALPTVSVENDATCAAAGEWGFGAAKTRRDAIVVTLGTGIGGGIISNGAVVRGARGFAGEIGHMVIEPDGPSCACGGHGCWEQFASGTGLKRLAGIEIANGRGMRMVELAAGDALAVQGEHVVAAASEEDPDGLAIIDTFSRYLAIGLSNLTEVLDPGCIILGGGLSRASGIFLDRTKAELATFRRGSGARGVEVVVAKLAERAGAFGAAGLAIGVIS